MIRLITTKRLEALKYAAARLEETTAEKEDLAALVAALQEDMAGTEETLNNVRAEASRLQQRVAELEGTPVGVLEAENRELAARVAARQEDMAGTEETLTTVRAEASRLQQRVAELEGTPVGVLEAENRELAARLAELEEQVRVSEPVLWPLLKAYAGVQMAW